MRASPQASHAALFGVLLGCRHAAPEDDQGARPELAPPEQAAPHQAPAPGPSREHPPDPGTPPALPPAVAQARQTLLRFGEHDPQALARARAVLDAFEAPQRFEERGELDGRPYYYARDAYERVGITVHHDGERITNVEDTRPPR